MPPRCPEPRWRSGVFGKGLPSLRVFMPLCPEGTPPPEMFSHSLRPSRRWPRRRASQGQAVGRALSPTRGGPAAPGCWRGAARAPRFRRTESGREAQGGNNATAAVAACSCLGHTPAAPVAPSGRAVEGKTAGNITWTEAASPAGRGKCRTVRTENQFGFFVIKLAWGRGKSSSLPRGGRLRCSLPSHLFYSNFVIVVVAAVIEPT